MRTCKVSMKAMAKLHMGNKHQGFDSPIPFPFTLSKLVIIINPYEEIYIVIP